MWDSLGHWFYFWLLLYFAGDLAALEEDEEGEGWGDDADLMIDEGRMVLLKESWQDQHQSLFVLCTHIMQLFMVRNLS